MDPIVILKSILLVSFLITGSLKILGVKYVRKQFADFKLNRGAMILFGVIEILLALGLFIENLAFFASICLAYVTSAALYKHIKANHRLIIMLPPFLLLILSMATAVLLLKPI